MGFKISFTKNMSNQWFTSIMLGSNGYSSVLVYFSEHKKAQKTLSFFLKCALLWRQKVLEPWRLKRTFTNTESAWAISFHKAFKNIKEHFSRAYFQIFNILHELPIKINSMSTKSKFKKKTKQKKKKKKQTNKQTTDPSACQLIKF